MYYWPQHLDTVVLPSTALIRQKDVGVRTDHARESGMAKQIVSVAPLVLVQVLVLCHL